MSANNVITAIKVNGTTYQIQPVLVTEITDQSTDNDIPSAAAVYTLVENSGGGGGGYQYETDVYVPSGEE